MNSKYLYILAFLLFSFGACASKSLDKASSVPTVIKKEQGDGKKHRLEGKASYYSTRLDGNKTASGEIFSSAKFTAAHRTLPFGTVVRVSDPKTKKSVIVTINDRGPFSKGRIIDLSKIAAKELDMIRRGTLWVEVVVEKWGASQRR